MLSIRMYNFYERRILSGIFQAPPAKKLLYFQHMIMLKNSETQNIKQVPTPFQSNIWTKHTQNTTVKVLRPGNFIFIWILAATRDFVSVGFLTFTINYSVVTVLCVSVSIALRVKKLHANVFTPFEVEFRKIPP